METIAEKQAVLERTVREKTAVEKELDKLYAESAAAASASGAEQIQTTSTSTAVEQLSRRVQTAERERDEALTQRDSAVNQIARNDLLYVSKLHQQTSIIVRLS